MAVESNFVWILSLFIHVLRLIFFVDLRIFSSAVRSLLFVLPHVHLNDDVALSDGILHQL